MRDDFASSLIFSMKGALIFAALVQHKQPVSWAKLPSSKPASTHKRIRGVPRRVEAMRELPNCLGCLLDVP
jgi:hypothetical protein